MKLFQLSVRFWSRLAKLDFLFSCKRLVLVKPSRLKDRSREDNSNRNDICDGICPKNTELERLRYLSSENFPTSIGIGE